MKASQIAGDFNYNKFIRDQHTLDGTDGKDNNIDCEYNSGTESGDICDDFNADFL